MGPEINSEYASVDSVFKKSCGCGTDFAGQDID